MRRKLLPAVTIQVEIDSKCLIGNPRSCFIPPGKPFGKFLTLHQITLEFGEFLTLNVGREERAQAFEGNQGLPELPGTTVHQCACQRPVRLRYERFCSGQPLLGDLRQVPQ